ncbi:hypothetical protein ACOSOMT5_P0561 [Acidiphilium sp. MT5]
MNMIEVKNVNMLEDTMMKREIAYKNTQRDTILANRLHLRGRLLKLIFILPLAIIGLEEIFAYIFLTKPMIHQVRSMISGPIQAGWAIGFSLVWVAMISYVFIPIQAWRDWQRTKNLMKDVTMRWDKDFLTIQTANGTYPKPTKEFLDIKVSKDMILLYSMPRLYFVVPTRAFESADQRMDLVRMIRAAILSAESVPTTADEKT